MPPTSTIARRALGLPALAPSRGDAQSTPPVIPASRDYARSEFIDRFPGLDFAPAWFTKIGVANPTIDAGSSAWYKIQSYNVPDDFAQMVGLLGFDVQMLATDSAGAGDEGAIDGLAWGTARGHGAAIVIGTNLPGELQAWSSGPADIPGVETTGAATLCSERPARHIAAITFPPGKLNDATPPKLFKERSFKPYIYRFAQGQSLDVSLVVRRSTITAKTGSLYGGCVVNFDLGLTRDRRSFGGS